MSTLDFTQLEQLWEQAGGSAPLAPKMAAIAEAESGGRTDALNNNPSTGDYSVGPWQINYFGALYAPRAARYGTPQQLIANPVLDAKAAVDLAGNDGSGLSNWTTYTSGAYKNYFPGGPGAATAASSSGGGGGGFSLNPLRWPGEIFDSFTGWQGRLAADVFSWAARLGASAVGAALIVVGLNRAFGVTDRISGDLQTAAGAAKAGAEVAA